MTYKLPNDGSAYAFVTREDIEKVEARNSNPNWISIASYLFAEREAYKLALMERIKDAGYGDAGLGDQADAEAARLLEGKNGISCT